MLNSRFDQLRERLIAEGIAPRYARRLCDELARHRDDLSEQLLAEGAAPAEAAHQADLLLGEHGAILKQVVDAGRFRSFGRRRPVMCFLLAPPSVLIVLAAAYLALLAAAGGVLDPSVIARLANWGPALALSRAVVPASAAALAAWAYCYSRRRQCAPRWPLAASAALALTAVMIFVDVLPPVDSRPGLLIAGVGLHLPPWGMLVHVAAPLGTFLLLSVFVPYRSPESDAIRA
jgi:hypothetical protein